MPEIMIDVDLDEFDTDDLANELCSRLRRYTGKRQMTEANKKRLREALQEINQKLLGYVEEENNYEVKSVDDQINQLKALIEEMEERKRNNRLLLHLSNNSNPYAQGILSEQKFIIEKLNLIIEEN